MRIIDKNFRAHIARYILQCLLATVAVMAVLSLMDVVHQTALIAALGASSFVAFTMPEAHVSQPRYLVGGYIVGIAVGGPLGLLHALVLKHYPDYAVFGTHDLSSILLGGMAVGMAIFLMVITDTEHPPAAGVALALVISPWNHWTILVISGAVVSLCVIKWLLRPFLRNLL